MPAPKMATGPSSSCGQWRRSKQEPRSCPAPPWQLSGAWLPAARACESWPTGRAQAAADRRSSPGGGGGGGWCPGGLAVPSSRSHEAPEPHQGMDKGKMDENEWGYHGEGNKSLVVAHAQVSGRQSARSGTLTLPGVVFTSLQYPLRPNRFCVLPAPAPRSRVVSATP